MKGEGSRKTTSVTAKSPVGKSCRNRGKLQVPQSDSFRTKKKSAEKDLKKMIGPEGGRSVR